MSLAKKIEGAIASALGRPGSDSPWSWTILVISWLVVLAGSVLLLMTSLSLHLRSRAQDSQARTMSRARAAEYAQIIDQELRHFTPIVERLAEALSNGTVQPSTLGARLAADLAAHPQLFEIGAAYAPFAASPEVELFAPHAARTGADGDIEHFQLEQRYDYTTHAWYQAGMVKPVWGEPYFGDATDAFVVGYMVPFFRPGDTAGTPIGVARVNLLMATIQNLVSTLSLGQMGYGFLLSHQGVYLSHPLGEYVRKQTTTFDVARQMNDLSRVRVAHLALAGQRTEEDSISPINGQQTLRLLQPIPVTGWVLGVVFFKDEVALDAGDVRRALMRILLSALLLGFGLVVVSFHVHAGGHRQLWGASLTSGALLLAGICVVWWLTLQYPDRNRQSNVQILDNSGLQKFLGTHVQKDVTAASASLVQVPTGILIRTIRIVDANDVFVTGNIWQRVPASERGSVTPGVNMPDGEVVELKELASAPQGEFDLVSWTFKVAARVPSEWSRQYPFDRALVRLRLIPKPSPKPVVLTPDLRGYALLTPSSLPGIEKSVVFPGWRLDHSYFSYIPQTAGITTAGIQSKALPFDLSYNAVAQRRFLDPFVSSVLPIIVVISLLFGLLLVVSKNTARVAATGFRATDILRASVSLLFPPLIAQVNLRSKVGASEFIYIEYFYFIVYTAILGVSSNVIMFTMRTSGVVQLRDNLIPKLMFWPAVLGLCMAVTLLFLY